MSMHIQKLIVRRQYVSYMSFAFNRQSVPKYMSMFAVQFTVLAILCCYALRVEMRSNSMTDLEIRVAHFLPA